MLIERLKWQLIACAVVAGCSAPVWAQNVPFYDLPEDHWAYESVRELADLGILTGYPNGSFDGDRTATRYEVAIVAARLLEYAGGNVPMTGSNAGALSTRLATIENALRNASSLAYGRRLEARIETLESALDIQAPASGQAADDAVALTPNAGTTGTASDGGASSRGVGGLRLVDIRFSVRPEYPFYVGISPGAVSTKGEVYLSVQAGYDGLVGPVGPAARLTFNGGGRELRLSADLLSKAELLVNELKVYGGLGVGVTVRPDGESLLLEAPFGGEYAITPRVGLFAQLTTSYSFAPISDADAELSSGVNLRF